MNLLKPLSTPEYLFRPRQILHRFRRALRRGPLNEFEMVELPWGSRIRVRPTEVIGSNIWCYGIFDLIVAETIWRLLHAGQAAADIGANIGQMTNLMRHRVGSRGRVLAFEPHPELFAELKYNLQDLPGNPPQSRVELHNEALSSGSGEAVLDVGALWSTNRGVARIVSGTATLGATQVRVPTRRLDDVLGDACLDLCKMDVEGHELKVLEGSVVALSQKRIRQLVFEDLTDYPSPVHSLLLDAGFSLFSLHASVWGPRLLPASQRERFDEQKEGKNYLATFDPQGATASFKASGWRVLRGGRNADS